MTSENNQEFFVFRPLRHFWLKRGIILLLALILGGLFLYMIEMPTMGFVMCLGPIILLVFSVTILPLLMTQLVIDSKYFKVRTPDHKFDLPWENIIVVRPMPTMKYDSLYFATDDNTFVVPLKFVDSHRVREIAKRFIPVSALEKDAYKNLDFYKNIPKEELEGSSEEFENIAPLSEPFRTSYSLWLKIVIGSALIISAYLTIWSIIESRVSFSSFILGAIFLASLYGIFKLSQRLQIDEDGITQKSWFGQRTAKWEDIYFLQHANIFVVDKLAVYDRHKKLIVSGPGIGDEDEFSRFISAQFTKHSKLRQHIEFL